MRPRWRARPFLRDAACRPLPRMRDRDAALACLRLQHHRDRYVIGWPLPTAGVTKNPEIADAVLQRRRDPDVIEPAAAIADRPVGGAIAPPGVDLLRERNPHSRHVAPIALLLRGEQLLAFDRRMRDDLQELLVRPHVVLVRRYVEIADQDVP